MLLLLGLALQPAAAAPNPPFGSYLLSCKNPRVQGLIGAAGLIWWPIAGPMTGAMS